MKKLPEGFVSPHILAGMPENTTVLLAFSGGADSSALLDMLSTDSRKHGYELCAAHVDHLIREDEHARDLEFCRNTAHALGVKFFSLTEDVPALAEKNHESLELTARKVRYEFFDRLMSENSIQILVTAHNADDNLETVLLNLTRGSGLRGMCGIPPARKLANGVLVRPILSLTKDEILGYCAENSIDFVTDSTNFVPDCSRNILRLNVIPELKKINPEVAGAARRMSDSLRIDSEHLDKTAGMAFEGDALPLDRLAKLPDSLKYRAVGLLIGESAEAVHVRAVTELAEKAIPHSSVSLPGNRRAVIEDRRIVITADKKGKTEDISPVCVTLLGGNNKFCENFSIFVSDNTENIYKYETQVTVSSDKIKSGLVARTRRPGDRIRIHGVNKSVKKLMCDLHVNIALRDRLPVVCDGDEIVYIPYVGVSDNYIPGKIEKVTYITLIKG